MSSGPERKLRSLVCCPCATGETAVAVEVDLGASGSGLALFEAESLARGRPREGTRASEVVNALTPSRQLDARENRQEIDTLAQVVGRRDDESRLSEKERRRDENKGEHIECGVGREPREETGIFPVAENKGAYFRESKLRISGPSNPGERSRRLSGRARKLQRASKE